MADVSGLLGRHGHFCRSFEEHVVRLRCVLDALRSADLTIKREKCHLGFQEVKFLGHVFSTEGKEPNPDKTAAVCSFPLPTDKMAIRHVLLTFRGRVLQDGRTLQKTMCHLCGQRSRKRHFMSCVAAFRTRKSWPTWTTLARHESELMPESALFWGNGSGGGQKRCHMRQETHYSATEKQCLAVAIAEFHPYLFGRPNGVVSEHSSLCWLDNLDSFLTTP